MPVVVQDSAILFNSPFKHDHHPSTPSRSNLGWDPLHLVSFVPISTSTAPCDAGKSERVLYSDRRTTIYLQIFNENPSSPLIFARRVIEHILDYPIGDMLCDYAL